MSANRYYYSNNSSSEAEKDDEFEYVPYSSSSVGSTGSIPWADLEDAIRQNQLEWERIERMLSGEEELPDEPELRNEIQEWRRKFFEKKSTPALQPKSFDSNSGLNPDLSLELDSISNLSLDSNEHDGFTTPTPTAELNFYTIKHTRNPSAQRMSPISSQTNTIDFNLRVNSVPIALQQRQRMPKAVAIGVNSNISEGWSPSPPTTHGHMRPRKKFSQYTFNKLPISSSASGAHVSSASLAQLRMPPILNTDTSRRFRTQNKDNHQSFVQLTRVQQPKSAAVVNLMSQRNYLKSNYNNRAWNNVPVTATEHSYVCNKNGIILPAINANHILDRTGGAEALPVRNSSRAPFAASRRNYIGSSASTATQSTTMRSISAAVRNPRMEAKSYYVPFNSRMINKC